MNIGSGNPHEGIRLPMFFYLPQASVCLAVVTFQHLLDVALAVERLAAEQEIGQYPLVAVLLQGTPAHVQPPRQVPVGEVTLAAHRRDVSVGESVRHFQASPDGLHGVGKYAAVLCQYIVIHLT